MDENKDNLVFKDSDILEYVISVFKNAILNCRNNNFNPVGFHFADLELFSRIIIAAKNRTFQLNILINNIKYRKIKSLAIISEIKNLGISEDTTKKDTKIALREKIEKIASRLQEIEELIKNDGIS